MSNLAFVPKITKMAKYLAALTANRQLTVYHLRLLGVLREMNTTASILSGLTGIENATVHKRLKELHAWDLISVVEQRKSGQRVKNLWGMHDDFRAVHKVPTYPSVNQEKVIAEKVKKGGRKLEMDEVAALLWGGPEASVGGRSEVLGEIATTLKRTPIPNLEAGDKEARRQGAVSEEPEAAWSLDDFVEDD